MSTPWKRREVIGDAVLYLGDCVAALPALGRFDAIVVDPPYGIGEPDENRNGSRSRGFGSVTHYPKVSGEWDRAPLSPKTIAIFLTCSRWQIIFGGNFYDLPPTSCWLVWDKETNGDFADCELAWTNLPKAVRRLRYMWNGCLRKERDVPRVHPTQKPVGVMEWCIGHLPADVETICDPCAGSGTTGVAAARLGKRFVGIERETSYFDIACKRIDEAQRQGRLFDQLKSKAQQLTLDGGLA